MAPSIRLYRSEDRAAARLVFYRAVREGSAAFYTEAERAAWAPSPDPDFSEPDKLLDQHCLVAEEGDRMTGFMSMDAAGYLDMAFVIPEVMGTGTAATLYDQLMAWAKSQNLSHFTVRAAEQSHRFLSRRGWHVDARERLEDGGEVYHLYLMSLDLP
jgi:putative acetyltransferase